MSKAKEWDDSKWPGGNYKGKPIGKHGPLPDPTKVSLPKKKRKILLDSKAIWKG